MNKAFIAAFVIPICSMFASGSNNVSNVIIDKIDYINTDMKQKYNLTINSDKSVLLTGYTIQDPISKLIRTYSVLHIDF